jgi:hypothetical protein
MITISTEKGLIKVSDWSEITGRVGFLKRLNPAEHELASILGRYVFPDKVNCGLSHCGTEHAKGYIVTTKDGHETNIGKDCGKKYFGVDFQVMANRFDRDMTEQENRETLWNVGDHLELIHHFHSGLPRHDVREAIPLLDLPPWLRVSRR